MRGGEYSKILQKNFMEEDFCKRILSFIKILLQYIAVSDIIL